MAAKGCDSSAVGNCGGDGRRCFRRASWTLIGLLMFGYAIQLSDIHERRSAAVARERLVHFVEQARQSGVNDQIMGMRSSQRIINLFRRFGGVFFAWGVRFYENRCFEAAFLRHPGATALLLQRAYPFIIMTAVLLMAGLLQSLLLERVRRLWARAHAKPEVTVVSLLGDEHDLGLARPSKAQSWRRCFNATVDGAPNHVCNTKVLSVKLPLQPTRVAAVKFAASLVIYFSSPDDFFFLFVAFGQVVENHTFRSCGPVMFFCVMFCIFEALAALRQAQQDTELNTRTCTVLRGAAAERVPWNSVHLGARVRLLSGETPPCDLLIAHVHGSLRAREKELTGESKPVIKQPAPGICGGYGTHQSQVRVLSGEDALQLGDDALRIDESFQLFRGTMAVLAPTDQAQPFVEGIAIRVGHDCKMYRECEVASQPPSILLERMSSIGMLLVLLLLLITYDNTLAIFVTSMDQGRSFLKVFFGNLIYENTLVPMSLKQVIMLACSFQAVWYAAIGIQVNSWHAVARLGELATEGAAAVLTDKTGTLTLNKMSTQVVARRVQPDAACSKWALFSARTPLPSLPTAHPASSCLELMAPQPFPAQHEEMPEAMRSVAFSWLATSGELPGDEAGEAEEASFLERVPGRLLSNVTDSAGGASVVFGMPAKTVGHRHVDRLLHAQQQPQQQAAQPSQQCQPRSPPAAPPQQQQQQQQHQALLSPSNALQLQLQQQQQQQQQHKPAQHRQEGGQGTVSDTVAAAATAAAAAVCVNGSVTSSVLAGVHGRDAAGGVSDLVPQHLDIALLLPLSRELRAKGAIVRGGWSRRPCHPGSSTLNGHGLNGGHATAEHEEIGHTNETPTLTLIAQGAGSFFKQTSKLNAGPVDLLEGGNSVGLLVRHFVWYGSVRIWWHGEKPVSEQELERAKSRLREARSAEARTEALRELYDGLVVTQASAMEDPYREQVPSSVEALRGEGYRIMMVTGDSDSAAENIAYATGIAVRGGEGDGARPLVRVRADTPAELLDAASTLLPASRLGEYCYLFGADAIAALQAAVRTLHESAETARGSWRQRTQAALVAAAASVAPKAMARCCVLRTVEPRGEVNVSRAVVEAMASLLTSGTHTAVWAQVSVDQKPFIAWFVQTHAKLMALAIGDGVNDVGMIRASHVSVGIRGSESHLAANAASFRAQEWKQLRPLLLQHAVRTMVLLSATMKWIYYKHAMTACMLEAWMVHNRYRSWRDPTDPVYMFAFNGSIYLLAIAYAVEDVVGDASAIRRKSLFSPASLLRWWLSGALHGFFITFALVLAFEGQTPREAGVRMQCIQSVVLTVRLAFITNKWLAWSDVVSAHDEPANDVESGAVDEVVERDDLKHSKLINWTLRALHTKVGHCVPCLLFVIWATTWTGVDTLAVLLVSFMVASVCLATDFLIMPRYGPMRYACELMLNPSRMRSTRVAALRKAHTKRYTKQS